jgi:predicted nucleic acid-binding Zn ribbon protein
VRFSAPNPPRRRRTTGIVRLPEVKPPAWHRDKSPVRKCVICGEEFPARNIAKTCSPECSTQLWLVQRRKYYAANSEKILAQQRQRQRPIIRKCVVCGKEFDNRKGAKTCSPGCNKEYRRAQERNYYLGNREKWVERERARQAKWSPKPRQCVVCGEEFVVANRKNSRANACPKHRHDRKLQRERARYHAKRGPRSSESRSISP